MSLMLAATARSPSSVKEMACELASDGQISGNAKFDAVLYMNVMAVFCVNSGMPPVNVHVRRPAGKYPGLVGASADPLK